MAKVAPKPKGIVARAAAGSSISVPQKANAERFTPEQVIAAIKAARGLTSIAGRALNCDPDTVRNYAKRYPDVAAALVEAREAMTDVAENSLYDRVKDGDAWAVCFYLKTQGKTRGYVERQEITGKDGGAIEHEDVSGAKDKLNRAVEQFASRRSGGGAR